MGEHRDRKRSTDDPVYIGWKRRHPNFPGVAKCVALHRIPCGAR
jgi:hypothetical protein